MSEPHGDAALEELVEEYFGPRVELERKKRIIDHLNHLRSSFPSNRVRLEVYREHCGPEEAAVEGEYTADEALFLFLVYNFYRSLGPDKAKAPEKWEKLRYVVHCLEGSHTAPDVSPSLSACSVKPSARFLTAYRRLLAAPRAVLAFFRDLLRPLAGLSAYESAAGAAVTAGAVAGACCWALALAPIWVGFLAGYLTTAALAAAAFASQP